MSDFHDINNEFYLIRKDPILPTAAEQLLSNERDYEALLVTSTEVLPDPRKIKVVILCLK